MVASLGFARPDASTQLLAAVCRFVALQLDKPAPDPKGGWSWDRGVEILQELRRSIGEDCELLERIQIGVLKVLEKHRSPDGEVPEDVECLLMEHFELVPQDCVLATA